MVKWLIFFCLFCSTVQAQSTAYQAYGKSIPELRQMLYGNITTRTSKSAILFIPVVPGCSKPVDTPLFFSPGLAQWKPDDLPFFCKIEHQMGKKLPVQFKFRLGSVDYVDWLEGKGHGNY